MANSEREPKPRRRIRVLIVDDHAMFAESVARLLEREADMTVVGVAATAAAAIAMAEATEPDVAVVDYGLPDADGARTAAGIRATSPKTNVLVLTGLADDGIATAAIQAGCSGFLTKEKAARELVAAVRIVDTGEAHIPPSHLVDLHRGLATESLKLQFVARIGHEFRSPLTAILGFGRLLTRSETVAPSDRDLAAQVVAGGVRLQRIVEILEFTASSSCGQLTLDARPTDVAVLIQDVIARWSTALGGGPHAIEHVAGRPSADVMVDRRWLAMAINELIDNAVKFSPEGGLITVTAANCELDGGDAVEVAVLDRGIGMTAAAREVAFEEFMQFDSSDTRSFGGLGLGLSLVRGVALAHGGTVACESAAPAGTRVTITIPEARRESIDLLLAKTSQTHDPPKAKAAGSLSRNRPLQGRTNT